MISLKQMRDTRGPEPLRPAYFWLYPDQWRDRYGDVSVIELYGPGDLSDGYKAAYRKWEARNRRR